MDTAAMVSVDIGKGTEILEILDRAKVKVGVALWAYLAEYEDWRLVLAAREFDKPDHRDSYRLLHDTLAAAGIGPRRLPTVLILPTTDPFIRELRRLFGRTKNVEGMRLGGQLIADRFLQDAYVYRVS